MKITFFSSFLVGVKTQYQVVTSFKEKQRSVRTLLTDLISCETVIAHEAFCDNIVFAEKTHRHFTSLIAKGDPCVDVSTDELVFIDIFRLPE